MPTFFGKDGIEVDPSKVGAVQQMKAPLDVPEFRRFLGMANQMGKHLPNLAQTRKPLIDLLSKQSAWIWDDHQQKAFEEIKKQLTSAPVLVIYDPQFGDNILSTCILVRNWSCIKPETT